MTVPVQLRPSPVYPGLHVQMCDPCVLLQRALTWHLSGYVLHSSTSVKKKKKKEEEEEEEREKNEKWDVFFMQKSYMCMYMKKVEYSFAIFWLNAILGLDL